jgi:hypothetical protein
MSNSTSAALRSGDPAVRLRAVVALRRLAEQVEEEAVPAARVAGWSWDQIGDALGISRQAAHKKHGKGMP